MRVLATGKGYLALACDLLHRVRLADPNASVWEAADLQWWWRRPRLTDAVPQQFWVDEAGLPMAAVLLTEWSTHWGLDVAAVPGCEPSVVDTLWDAAQAVLDEHRVTAVESLVRTDDPTMTARLVGRGFVPGAASGEAWLASTDRLAPGDLPPGYRLVDRASHPSGPHPMAVRNGEHVEQRLRGCSLYEPGLDLFALDDQDRGYALFWNDPVTGVGLVEPVRVEDEHSGRGLGRALVTAGVDRLARHGARRVKIGFETERARRLYLGLGFEQRASQRTYHRPSG